MEVEIRGKRDRQTEIGTGMGIVVRSSYQVGFPTCTRKRRLELCESLLSHIRAMSFSTVIMLVLTRRQCVVSTPHTVSAEASIYYFAHVTSTSLMKNMFWTSYHERTWLSLHVKCLGLAFPLLWKIWQGRKMCVACTMQLLRASSKASEAGWKGEGGKASL